MFNLNKIRLCDVTYRKILVFTLVRRKIPFVFSSKVFPSNIVSLSDARTYASDNWNENLEIFNIQNNEMLSCVKNFNLHRKIMTREYSIICHAIKDITDGYFTLVPSSNTLDMIINMIDPMLFIFAWCSIDEVDL